MQVNMLKRITVSFKFQSLGKTGLIVQHIIILNGMRKWLNNMGLKMDVNEIYTFLHSAKYTWSLK
jgi:hypothetical protein